MQLPDLECRREHCGCSSSEDVLTIVPVEGVWMVVLASASTACISQKQRTNSSSHRVR